MCRLGVTKPFRCRIAAQCHYPSEFGWDVTRSDRMARFQRAAKVLVSLKHPNIATIRSLEDSDTTHALVMELIEGPTIR
jgi:serine/threonine protein kinase